MTYNILVKFVDLFTKQSVLQRKIICIFNDHCLADNTYTGAQAIVSGWGAKAETGNWSCTLLEAEIPILSNEACKNTKYNASKIKDVMMCAGFPETAHKDACTVSTIDEQGRI